MATNGVSLRSTFWSLVWRKKRVLIRSCSRPWAWTSFLDFEESTHRFHTYNWWGITILAEKKQNKRVINVLPPTDRTVWHEESREDMSNSLFWTGVPVTTHRREARSLQTACYMPAFGLWISWASRGVGNSKNTKNGCAFLPLLLCHFWRFSPFFAFFIFRNLASPFPLFLTTSIAFFPFCHCFLTFFSLFVFSLLNCSLFPQKW